MYSNRCKKREPPSYDIENLIHLKKTEPKRLLFINSVLRVLIDGICDGSSNFSLFFGTPHILELIWNKVTQYWKSCIKDGIDLDTKAKWSESVPLDEVAYSGLGHIEVNFPKPTDLYINMMPFVMAKSFEESKLPEYLKPWWDGVLNRTYYAGNSPIKIMDNQIGKIGFLTIHESYVEADKMQRRGGVHTDCPGKLMICPVDDDKHICLGRVHKEDEEEVHKCIESRFGSGYVKDYVNNFTHPWGMVMTSYGTELVGGIYMASNVKNSCEIWDCQILADKNGDEIIGNLGDVEHLKEYLPRGEKMHRNMMYWMTDRTPHASLRLEEGTYRQYFRLVTSDVSLWFEEHSTKNPLGVVPDPAVTKVVTGSKFDANFVMLLDLDPDEQKER